MRTTYVPRIEAKAFRNMLFVRNCEQFIQKPLGVYVAGVSNTLSVSLRL